MGFPMPLNLAGMKGLPDQLSIYESLVKEQEVENQRRQVNRNIREMDRDEFVMDISNPLWDRIHRHLGRRMLFVDELCPPLTASIGGHLADLHQANPDEIPNGHECPFYFFKGQVEVLNIPINIISPAGLSKSHMMAQYFERKTGICPIRAKFRGNMTEAGYVGRENLSTGEPTPGDAYEFRNGFLLFNEISNIMIASSTSHSASLINQVMESLSERRVTKRTGGIDLSYETRLTIWGGIQPRRFDFSQGLGRRFLHVTKAWTPDDVALFKEEREREKLSGRGSFTVNMDEVEQIRNEISDLLYNAQVEKVEWTNEIYQYMKKRAIGHLDLQMMERVLIGKAYINQGLNTIIKIHSDKSNKKLIDMVVNMNKIVAEGGDISLLLSTLGKTEKSRDALWLSFRRFGYQFVQFTALLDSAISLHLIGKKYDKSSGGYTYYRMSDKPSDGVNKPGRSSARRRIIDKLKKRQVEEDAEKFDISKL